MLHTENSIIILIVSHSQLKMLDSISELIFRKSYLVDIDIVIGNNFEVLLLKIIHIVAGNNGYTPTFLNSLIKKYTQNKKSIILTETTGTVDA